MDDIFDQPKAQRTVSDARDEDDEQSSGDEDGGLDWTKLPSGNVHRPVIPKRGEKDFEPSQRGGGSGLQLHHLDRARTAMFDALRATRAISNKSVSYAIWYPTIARAHVTAARGVHYSSMGHSIARPSPTDTLQRAPKRLELLPEEALYLVEKGALFCWKHAEGITGEDMESESSMQGAPMSVQQAFAEMIGMEGVSIEKYHVFAYLRRLGYIVIRAKPLSPSYPVAAPHPPRPMPTPPSILRRIYAAVFAPVSRRIRALFRPAFDWWRPLIHRRWLHHNMDYPSVFKSIRFIPSGHATPLLPLESHTTLVPSPYEVFYHVYKPNTPFRKTAPPPPDFHIVVVNARTTPIPTLAELTTLYASLPTLPLPLPRRRNLPPAADTAAAAAGPQSLLARLHSILRWRRVPPPPQARNTELKVNPFMALRQGNKTVVIAAVDASIVSFFRFGEGAFEDWPMA
ncbi:hypothetical protein BV25DRAFT_1993519 [Artomyces pyxidatus]|uniref:Uncharacterized protein n=1 Tax=Artomyces pyxidatus TaxID=48021 RepID=A0ACB8STZ6_9AGAM|nr:hypothetical protein BV25DRAFT_1993519 [Artomyces pyxidatus]